MNMIERAFTELYPDREFEYDAKIRYSARFSDYNANVRMNVYSKELIFSLSRKWKSVSPDIKIGLLQELMVKLFKNKKKTLSIDLYNQFMKNIHIAAPKLDSDPKLIESFNRVNENFFHGMIDPPNLIWGQLSRRKLGSYQYGSDTISVSRIMQDAPRELLDYIVYHEVLHKKHKFRNKNGRNYHHTADFRRQESRYPEQEDIEKQLTKYLRRQPGIKRNFFYNLFR